MLKVIGYEKRVLAEGDTIIGLIRGLSLSPLSRKMWFFCNQAFIAKNGKKNFSPGMEVQIPIMMDTDAVIGEK